MIKEVSDSIWYFLSLTIRSEAFWLIFPLVVTTFIMVAYFQRYNDEREGWNTFVGNSLVLLFVSASLFRYVYILGVPGIHNFVDYLQKSVAALLLLLFGMILLKFNFNRVLPEKLTEYISSPLTVNLGAYVLILFVYSDKELSWIVFLSLLIIFAFFLTFFNLIKIPIKKLFVYLKKMKDREQRDNIREEEYQIGQLRRELRIRENNLKNTTLKGLNKQGRESKKLGKIVKKVIKKIEK